MQSYLDELNKVSQGKVIKAIRLLLPHALDSKYWPEPNPYEPALLIELEDGNRLAITQDSEGNGSGAISVLA